MSNPQPLRGAIVRAERFVGVALGQSGDGVIVVPAVKGPGQHRSDVTHAEPFIPSSHRIRVGDVRVIHGPLVTTGRISPATLSAIEAAMARELRASEFERRHTVVVQTERCVVL